MRDVQEKILDEIQDERDRQDVMFGQKNDDALLTNDWVAILVRQIGLAASDGAAVDDTRFHRQMVRTAATAVAALEAFRRRHPDHTMTPEKPAGHSSTSSGV